MSSKIENGLFLRKHEQERSQGDSSGVGQGRDRMAASVLIGLEQSDDSEKTALAVRAREAVLAAKERRDEKIDFQKIRSLLGEYGAMNESDRNTINDAFREVFGSFLADMLITGGEQLLGELEDTHERLKQRYGGDERDTRGVPLYHKPDLEGLLIMHSVCGTNFEGILQALDISNINNNFEVVVDEGYDDEEERSYEKGIFSTQKSADGKQFILRFDMYYANRGHIEREFIQDIDAQGNAHLTVEARKFEIPEDLQGYGIGKEVLKRSLSLYDDLGTERITLVAGNDSDKRVGSYAWARYGFNFDKKTFTPDKIKKCIASAKDNARNALEQLNLLDTVEGQDALRAYDELLANPDDVTPFHLSEIGKNIVFIATGQESRFGQRMSVTPYEKDRVGNRNKAVYLGQYAMFSNSWHGVMDVSIGANGEKSLERQRLEAYLDGRRFEGGRSLVDMRTDGAQRIALEQEEIRRAQEEVSRKIEEPRKKFEEAVQKRIPKEYPGTLEEQVASAKKTFDSAYGLWNTFSDLHFYRESLIRQGESAIRKEDVGKDVDTIDLECEKNMDVLLNTIVGEMSLTKEEINTHINSDSPEPETRFEEFFKELMSKAADIVNKLVIMKEHGGVLPEEAQVKEIVGQQLEYLKRTSMENTAALREARKEGRTEDVDTLEKERGEFRKEQHRLSASR